MTNRTYRILTGALLSGALLLAAAPTSASADTAPPLDRSALRAAISDLEHPPVTAAQIRVSGWGGHWYGTSGVVDRRTDRPVRPGDRFKIGSITKAFVATVVLQLVGEDRVRLTRPVQRYLPGVLPARFPPITVGQLLNHTSGLPPESGPDLPDLSTPEAVFAHRFDQWTPERLVAMVTDQGLPMAFEPGTAQEYRGINYVLAAMVVEEVTGHRYGREIRDRILRPLGLRDTSVPGNRPGIPGPHVHGYLEMSDGRLRDITVANPSDSWGEGEMISTTGDLTRFLSALFSGGLLPPRLLERMVTLPPDDVRMLDGSPARYGMGLQTATVNGVTLWGKTGERYGYSSGMFATLDQQRRLVWSFTPTHRDASQTRLTLRIVEAATAPAG